MSNRITVFEDNVLLSGATSTNNVEIIDEFSGNIFIYDINPVSDEVDIDSISIVEDNILLDRTSDINVIEIYNDQNGIVNIYDPGPKGDKGDQGAPGFSGAGEPFFVIRSGSLYASTASIALINAFVSSSLLPWSGSFDLGSNSYPWKTVYVTESIFIIRNGQTFVTIDSDHIQVSASKITTSSFGFEIPIIQRIKSDQQTFLIQSASISSSINNDGVFSIGDFNYLPIPIPGGIIKFGSDFYFGI